MTGEGAVDRKAAASANVPSVRMVCAGRDQFPAGAGAAAAGSALAGAAGVAEYVFGGFFSDYVPLGVAAVIALTWRLLGYYSYLVAGCILIPSWWKSTFSEKPVEN